MKGIILFILTLLIVLLIREVYCGIKDGSFPLGPFHFAYKYKYDDLPQGYWFRIVKVLILLNALIYTIYYVLNNVLI